MNDVTLVQLADAKNDLGREEFDVCLGEWTLLTQKLVHVSTGDMRHDKVESKIGLKEVLHAAQVLVLNKEHYAHLVESTLDLALVNEQVLPDTLDCVEFACISQLSKINAAIATSSQLSLDNEVI